MKRPELGMTVTLRERLALLQGLLRLDGQAIQSHLFLLLATEKRPLS
jgi:hypothetical protein